MNTHGFIIHKNNLFILQMKNKYIVDYNMYQVSILSIINNALFNLIVCKLDA